MSYIFYSYMYYPSEDIKLTANVSLASEVSAYTLGTAQKDDKGNFYNVIKLTPGRPYIFSITNNGNSDLNSMTYVYAYKYTETDGGKIGGSNQNEPIELSIAVSEENWISYTAEEDGVYTFTVSEPSNYGYMYLYQMEDSQLTQISPNNSNYGTYFSSGSEGKITNIILNKGAQVLVRIYQTNHGELTCNVQPSWAIWDITSIENNSNTKTITTNTSGEEGKVWLAFGENIAEGKYTISTSSTSVTLKLYQDREEVVNIPNSGTDEQQGNTVTFEYQQNAVYQLGIATTQSSVNLTITKEPESETPDEGGNSSDSGDNSGEGDNTGEENNTSSDI